MTHYIKECESCSKREVELMRSFYLQKDQLLHVSLKIKKNVWLWCEIRMEEGFWCFGDDCQAKPSKLTQVAVMSLGTGTDRDEALRRAVCITAGVIVAKQLVAAPANVLTPGPSPLYAFGARIGALINIIF